MVIEEIFSKFFYLQIYHFCQVGFAFRISRIIFPDFSATRENVGKIFLPQSNYAINVCHALLHNLSEDIR